jgi:hypothetical protein
VTVTSAVEGGDVTAGGVVPMPGIVGPMFALMLTLCLLRRIL